MQAWQSTFVSPHTKVCGGASYCPPFLSFIPTYFLLLSFFFFFGKKRFLTQYSCTVPPICRLGHRGREAISKMLTISGVICTLILFSVLIKCDVMPSGAPATKPETFIRVISCEYIASKRVLGGQRSAAWFTVRSHRGIDALFVILNGHEPTDLSYRSSLVLLN